MPDGTSPSTVEAITTLINRAYGHYRVSPNDVHHRMRAGRNRVLHVATREGVIVGACSSTLYVPWCGPGTGHWGLLAVAPEAQGCGVASALVAAAEARLQAAGLSSAGMEYRYHAGDAFSERMIAWYEDNLRYVGPASRHSGFRMCRKRLDGAGGRGGGGPLAAVASSVSVLIAWFLSVLLWMCCGQY